MDSAVVLQEAQPLTAAQVKTQVQLVQQVMSAVMIKDKHYGAVPGCGDKPTLLKPGAEKLMMTFRLAADPQVQEIPTDDGITFRVICRITNQATGLYLGSGIGECSSKEEKYNWRKAICDGEFNDTPEDRRRKKWAKGYNGKPDHQIPQIRTNPADVANTVLKMAKKRALVDAILTVTAASDIFDQDLEEMPEELRQNREPQAKKSATVKPANKTAPTTESSSPPNQIIVIVDEVTSKSGNKNGKDWQAWTIHAAGEKYGTFSESFAAIAVPGETVNIGYTVGKYGNEIISIEPVPC